MANIDFRIKRALEMHWDSVRQCIDRLNNSVTIVPNDAGSIIVFSHSTPDVTFFEIAPTLLVLPERANDVQNNMHVVLKGRLAIDKAHFVLTSELRTASFQSEAGYFRLRKSNSTLQHVYGAHYDLAEDEAGHPAFHVQLKSFVNFSDVVQNKLSAPLTVVNGMDNVLKTVRVPSAQMDYFALLLQVIADHLISANSSTPQEIQLFKDLIAKNKSIQGRAYEIARLHSPSATSCYRAVHWYP